MKDIENIIETYFLKNLLMNLFKIMKENNIRILLSNFDNYVFNDEFIDIAESIKENLK